MLREGELLFFAGGGATDRLLMLQQMTAHMHTWATLAGLAEL